MEDRLLGVDERSMLITDGGLLDREDPRASGGKGAGREIEEGDVAS